MSLEEAGREMSKAVNFLIKFVAIAVSTGDQGQLQTFSDLALKHMLVSENICSVRKDELEQIISKTLIRRQELESKININNSILSKTTSSLESIEADVFIWEGLERNAQKLYKEKEKAYLELEERYKRGRMAVVGANVATAAYGLFLTFITAGAAAPIAVGMQAGVTLTSSLALYKATCDVNSAKCEYYKCNTQLNEYCKEKMKLQDDSKTLSNECENCRKERQNINEEHKHLLEGLAKTATLLECLLHCRHFISIFQGRTEVLKEARKDIAFQHDLRLPLKEINKHLTSASSFNSFNLQETRQLCEHLSGQLKVMPNSFSDKNICNSYI